MSWSSNVRRSKVREVSIRVGKWVEPTRASGALRAPDGLGFLSEAGAHRSARFLHYTIESLESNPRSARPLHATVRVLGQAPFLKTRRHQEPIRGHRLYG